MAGRHVHQREIVPILGVAPGPLADAGRAARYSAARAPIAQSAEAFGSNPIQCGFESHSGHSSLSLVAHGWATRSRAAQPCDQAPIPV